LPRAGTATLIKPRRADAGIRPQRADASRFVSQAGTSAEAEAKEQADAEWERERAARAVREKLAGPGRAAAAAPERDDGADAGAAGGEGDYFDARLRRKILDKRREQQMGDAAPAADAAAAGGGAAAAAPRADGKETREEKEARRAARALEKQEREAAARAREADKLKRLGLTKLAAEVDAGGLFTAGEVKRREIKAKKLRTADREKETLAKLHKFQAALSGAPAAAAAAAPPEPAAEREGALGVARYVAQGLYYADEADADEDPNAWRAHSLAFAATKDSRSFAPGVDDYVVEDPLMDKAKAAFSKKGQKDGKRSADWAGRSRT
jgi:hypothetical protein